MSDAYDDFSISATRGDSVLFECTFTRPPGLAAVAAVDAGAVTEVTVLSGAPADGSAFSAVPAVVLVGGGGTGALATATVADGAVSAITVTAPGAGYAVPPQVIVGPVNLTGASLVCTGRRALAEDADAFVFRLTLGSGIAVIGVPGNGQARVTVPPEATEGMPDWPRLYVDVELTEADGRVSTPVKGRLVLEPDTSRVP